MRGRASCRQAPSCLLRRRPSSSSACNLQELHWFEDTGLRGVTRRLPLGQRRLSERGWWPKHRQTFAWRLPARLLAQTIRVRAPGKTTHRGYFSRKRPHRWPTKSTGNSRSLRAWHRELCKEQHQLRQSRPRILPPRCKQQHLLSSDTEL